MFGGFIAIVLLIGICWGGHDVYVRWQERRLVRRAVVALQQRDLRNASLAARTVLQLKPTSAPAARIMAELGERTNERGALEWRRKVVQLEPHSTEDILALARCALQFNDIAGAEKTLGQIEEAGKQTAGYHAIGAQLATARGQGEQAISEWSEAVRLAPNDKIYQLQFAVSRLRSTNPEQHAAGEEMLTALRNDVDQRAAATRALITEGIVRHGSAPKLLELARDLQAFPEAKLNDRLLYLDLLHQLQDPQFTAYLTEFERSSATKPLELTTLLGWMSQNNLNLLALDFLKTLPRETLEKWPMPTAVADVYVRLKDWHNLEGTTKTGNWRDFDFLRHAYLARALREQDKSAAAEHEWAIALKDGSARSESGLVLLRTLADWKWETETVDLLWALAKLPEKQSDAFSTLYRYYAKANDTQGLYKVLVRLFESDPSNLNVQNNLAQISLLLNANPEQARRLAADAYRKMPSNAAYATTYAYSLMTKGDISGALKIMTSLTEEQLRDPAVSAYYGICLAAAKDQRARSFLEAAQSTTLLPEEKALVNKATAQLN